MQWICPEQALSEDYMRHTNNRFEHVHVCMFTKCLHYIDNYKI